MAHVQQLFDHINKNFKDTYKSGIWVKSYVTGIAANTKGNVFFECIDAMKFDKQKPAAKVIFRLIDPLNDSFLELCNKLGINSRVPDRISFKPGQCYMSFKVLPMVHFERGMMPLIKDIDADEDRIGIENMRSGLRVGLENRYLGKPENNMKPWSDDDVKQLSNLLMSTNLSIESIALVLKRTPIACVDKADLLAIVGKERISQMRQEALKIHQSYS